MGQLLSRREFMVNTTGGLVLILAACRSNAASSPAAEKIFLEYDEAELDAAYKQGPWADNIDEVYTRLEARNAAALAELGEPERHTYGSNPTEGLDWYRTDHPDAPIHIYFHGGAWGWGDARSNAFVARPSVIAGAHVVIPDYVKVIEVGGNLLPLGEQCREAVAWVYRNADKFNADRDRILVSGHSAGGHLAGVVLTTDWNEFDLPTNTVKQGLLASGMYDLYPVSLSSRNEYISFTTESIAALSPLRHLDRLSAEVVVAFGTKESPEFQRQSLEFFSALRREGKSARLIEAKGMNHFEILENLGDANGVVGHAALELMRLLSRGSSKRIRSNISRAVA
jgi:arylformamidase